MTRQPAETKLIRLLETRLVNAWPSLEAQVVDGWLVRFADGYSKRANSATAFELGAALEPTLIEHIIGQFECRGIRPVFRLTGVEGPGAETVLSERGLIAIEPSLCLAAAVEPGPIDPDVRLERAASRRWVEQAAGSYGGDKADALALRAIISRITNETAFATLAKGGEDLAWGFAVAERGFLGLYDVVVAPSARGRGYGRRLCRALMAWGAERAAHTAYLQVRADNATARALYASLGFDLAYRYVHWAAPLA